MLGPVRRKAMQAASEAYEAASGGRNFAADMQDGFGIDIVLDLDQLVGIVKDAMAGKRTGKVKLPIAFVIDPKVDTKE